MSVRKKASNHPLKDGCWHIYSITTDDGEPTAGNTDGVGWGNYFTVMR